MFFTQNHIKHTHRLPPQTTIKAGRRPPVLRFPEDDIIRAYYHRNPNASLEPIDLGSFEPSTARRFASRQLELVSQGLSRKEARLKTDEEFKAAAAAANEKGVVEVVQAEEEAQLKQALATYIERHGHTPLPGRGGGGGGGGHQRQTQSTVFKETARKMAAPRIVSSSSAAGGGSGSDSVVEGDRTNSSGSDTVV